MRRYPEDIIEAKVPSILTTNRFQYKTPNYADDLAKKEKTSTSNYVGRSTQRAFNLKKHWAAGPETTVNNSKTNVYEKTNEKKSVEKSEIDNRLKSLMDRLSNQQKLLKPAEKPSTEMEHFMKRSGLKSASTDKLVTSPLSAPVLLSRQTSESNGFKFNYPPPYQTNGITESMEKINSERSEKLNNTVSSTTAKTVPETPRSNGISHNFSEPNDSTTDLEQNPPVKLIPSEVNDKKIPEFKDVETLEVPQKLTIEEEDEEEYIDESDDDSDIETCQNGSEIQQPPPIPPIPDIYVEEHQQTKDENDPHSETDLKDTQLDTTYESCRNEESNDSAYMTPANELSLNPEHLKDSDIPLMDDDDIIPFSTSTPQEELRSPTESEKSFIQKHSDVKLTDDEIMRIYEERNPLERLAKFNSLKRKQSNVVHDIILSRSANRPRTRRTRVAVPSSSIPPVPSTEYSVSITTTPVRPRASTEPPMATSLPATPLTDPAKFGIPPTRPARNTTKKPEKSSKNPAENKAETKTETEAPPPTKNAEIDKLDGIVSSADDSLPNSPVKKPDKSNKKTLMQTISGIFRGTSTTRMASPEQDSLTSPSSNSERKSRSDSFMKFLGKKKSPVSSPEAPRANLSEISDDSNNLKLIFKPSHPSTPPVPLSRKITITRHASEESLSDTNDEDHNTSGETSLNIINGQVPPEIMEKIMKRGGKSHKRAAKVAHLKRVRKAQEIQRQLEELDVIHRDLEDRGIEAEKSIRDDPNDDPDLLQTWFVLLAEKNALVRHEQELLVQAKQLELEDKSARLEAELREHLLLDSRSAESVSREGNILQELLAIAEQRELLQNMLERDQRRYQKEDKDIEAQMKAKGLRITPVRKLSFARLTTSSTA